MNEKQKEGLILAINTNDHICINIETFVNILNGSLNRDQSMLVDDSGLDFNVISVMKILKTGKYATFKNGTVACWVHKNILPGFIKTNILNIQPSSSSDEDSWGEQISLENYKK